MLLSSESENFVATRNSVDLGKILSLFQQRERERETFSEDFVAPSVDPCAIVAGDCLQWSLHSHHVLSPPVPAAAGYNQVTDQVEVIDDVTDS